MFFNLGLLLLFAFAGFSAFAQDAGTLFIAPEVQAFLQTIILGVIGVVVRRLVTEAILWFRAKRVEIETRLGPDKLFILQQIGRFVHDAAEQAGLADLIANEGAAKKAFALDLFDRLLDQIGLTGIDPRLIDAAIEGAVLGAKRDTGVGLATVVAEPLHYPSGFTLADLFGPNFNLAAELQTLLSELRARQEPATPATAI